MRNWRRQLIASIACVLSCLSVVLMIGCQRQSSEKETVVLWVMGFEGEVVAKLLPEFERQHPEIKVDLQKLPWLSAHEKLLTAYAGEALPDVVPMGNTWIAEFEALDALEPLEDYISATPGFTPEDYFQGAMNAGRVNGMTYAIPWYSETRLPYYRKDILRQTGFEQPPETWSEWQTALAAIKQSVGTENYSILLPLNEFEPLLNLAIQQQEPLLRDDGRYGNFRSEGFKQTLTFYKNMFDQGWAPKSSATAIANVWDEFGKGYFSFYISGPWNIAEFKKRLPAELQNDWMTMRLPGITGPGASVVGGTNLVIFKQSKNKQAAWKLVEFLSSTETQIKLHAMAGDLPSRRSAWQTPALKNDPYATVFQQQLEAAKPVPQVPEWERIATELRNVGEQLVFDKLTVEQAAEEMDRRADKILEKRRWMLEQKAQQGAVP